MERSDLVIFWSFTSAVALTIFLVIFSPKDRFSFIEMGRAGNFVCRNKSEWFMKNPSGVCIEWKKEMEIPVR